MKKINYDVPKGFDTPTDLPNDNNESKEWQERNKTWWENNPMRYDWNEGLRYAEFSREFYQEIDKRFFSNAAVFLPPIKIPFDRIINFEKLNDKEVLEIGIGNGSHAGLLAQCAKNFTGIDLTEYAVKSTSMRFKLFGLNGRIVQMDAEKLDFDDNSFDFIWSWGVIHHSSNTRNILKEMHRVLRPGGEAVIMVYHRSFWLYYIMTGVIRGILLGGLFKDNLNNLLQKGSDGAIARHYTIKEWKNLSLEFFKVEDIKIFGSKAEILPLPGSRIKNIILGLIPNSISRLLTNEIKMGSFLVSRLMKIKKI